MKVCTLCGSRFNHSDWRCPECDHNPSVKDGFTVISQETAWATEGFEETFFAQLFDLEADNFWFCERSQLIIWALRKYFSKSQNFLEIGCGTGFVLSCIEQSIPTLSLTASDVFINGLHFASQRVKNATLFQMDARSIPFVAEFDVIGAFDVIEHIKADQDVLKQMYQAVKDGGGIILTVPQHPWLWSQADEHGHHVRRYTANELRKKVEQAGFKVIKTTSFVTFLLPVMFLSRLRMRTAEYDVATELKLNRHLNLFLKIILSIERMFIRAGLTFPVGGSLLLVAQK